MSTTKILLKENEIIANEIIANARIAYSNGRTILSMLDKIGLKVDTVTDWSEIEAQFTKDFPKATLTFNLQALGIETEYREAEAFYLKHRYTLRFTHVTDEEIEGIKEANRVYATTEKQIEIVQIFERMVNDLNRLKELGAKIDENKTYLVSRVLNGYILQKPFVMIDKEQLYHTVINLK